ncbi:MAG TPA: flagellar hook-associated protein FlgK [Bryobacteraceae bacterium]|nr:flagellar hook-associated protein FlgK [Bryobacteraceae bacterium]
MGNLFAGLTNSANALRVFEDGLTVVQNNVTNASTPGYVEQTQVLDASELDLNQGLVGGVTAGPVIGYRDQYAEQAVQQQQTSVGFYNQKVSDLTPLQSFFALSSSSGLSASMDALFSSFSQLSINPNDTVSRQDVLNKAAAVAQQFRSAASGLLSQTTNLNSQTRSIINHVNQLAATIAQVNGSGRVDAEGTVNAGLDAQLNSSLEQLSQYVNFTTLQQPDGTVSVLVGGQTPLVVGDQAYNLQGDFTTPQTAILSSTGADITAQVTGGQLAATIDDNNNIIPSYVTDLNTLAQSLADQVNTTLDNGIDQNGAAPTTDLFSYDPVQGAALTLNVNPLTTDQIAAALPGSPGGNGNALAAAQLANATAVSGYTFSQFFGNLGGRVGNDVLSATNSQATKQNLLSQAQTLRQQVSGVSLDTEAEKLIALQKSYEATSKMFTVLNQLTETLINVIH